MFKNLPVINLPFNFLFSFHKLIETFQTLEKSDVKFQADYAREILKETKKYPELISGLENLEELPKYESVLNVLLADLFPKATSHNEIKAVSVPFQANYAFNYTERFKKIISEAGKNFNVNIRGFSEEHYYIVCCCIILKMYYKIKIDVFDYPLFVDIPDKNNIIHHYRILFNIDMVEAIPTDNAKMISEEEIAELLDDGENIDLWKEKFPEKSWTIKGFSIITLYDATTENAVSNFKSRLLSGINEKIDQFEEIEVIFKSIYKVPDLKIGFTAFANNNNHNIFKKLEPRTYSHFSFDSSKDKQSDLCSELFERFRTENKFMVISDVQKYYEKNLISEQLAILLKKQNVSSCIFAPITENNKLLGVLELSSSKTQVLNTINANKLDFVLPLVKDTINKAYIDLDNQIEAVIQQEYTSIHPSVKWKFQEEVVDYINAKADDREYILKDVVFSDVWPLYGQIDVQGSSNSRNTAIKEDIKAQLNALTLILEKINQKLHLPFIEQKLFEIQVHLSELEEFFLGDTEYIILDYLKKEIHPILINFKNNSDELTRELINSYFREIEFNNGAFNENRKMFDESIAVINKKLAIIIDEKQVEAQKYFPHYYERFKTDGIEHNMYMGASIAPNLNFENYYLSNLRLWQIQVMCEMENHFRQIKPRLSYDLEVSSLILVFGNPISIRFRMDEKQFDIDGSYSVRYEIAKKRIDKAKIKNTEERITQKGKLTIVYTYLYEKEEYLGYIKLLQHKGLLNNEIEQFEVEDLQGIIGLKAIRVGFVYPDKNKDVYSDYKVIQAK